MPNVLIDPDVPLDTRIRDIPSSNRIPNFTSRFLFFDHIVLPAERLYHGTHMGVDGTRHLFDGKQTRFLEETKTSWVFRLDGKVNLRDACLSEKKTLKKGILIRSEKATLHGSKT